jgi:hypothetical protein
MEETEQRAEQENREEHAETEKPTSERESSLDQESIICPETEGKLDFLKEFEGRPITERCWKSHIAWVLRRWAIYKVKGKPQLLS